MNRRVEVVDEAGGTVAGTGLAQLAEAVLEAEGRGGALTIVLVSEAVMTDLNLRYRGSDGPTDVLSFAEEGGGDAWPDLECDAADAGGAAGSSASGVIFARGEMIVCPAVVRRYAGEEGVTPAHQLGWTVIHGTLHLLGHDHEVDQGEMRAREGALLHRFAAMLQEITLPADIQT